MDIQNKNRSVSVANWPVGSDWLERSLKGTWDRKQKKNVSWIRDAMM